MEVTRAAEEPSPVLWAPLRGTGNLANRLGVADVKFDSEWE
jgi:hypothetical protein